MATAPLTEEPQAEPVDLEDLANLGATTDPAADNPELQDVIKGLCKHFIGLDKWVRRQEVIECRRQRFYWRGDQYIYWKSDSVGFIPAVGGSSVTSGEYEVDLPRYTDVYNIYTPYGESILAILIQNPPGINWQPVDPGAAEDITAYSTAEKYQQVIENNNNRRGLQSDISRFYYTDGRVVSLVERDEQENYDKISIHGVLETKAVPMTATEQCDLVSMIISDELDIYRAKDLYPNNPDKIVEGAASLGESAYERIARLGVLQGTKMLMQAGDAFSHMVTRHRCFLRPSTFEKADKRFQEKLKELYPDGLKAIFCGEAYCKSENVSMDDQISISFPSPGDGMSRPSLGKRVVPLQDVFNDELNLWHEAHDFCVPTLYMYSETGDIDSIREQISQPGSVVPFTALPPGATTAQAAFYASVLEAIPATLPQLIQFIQGPLAQFISGAFPALFGGDTGQNDTAKGISIQRDQSMGRMSFPWSALQMFFASFYLQAVKSAVKYSPEDQTFNYTAKDMAGNSVNESLSLNDLKNGQFKCRPDTDSTFPDSTNQKRATFQMLMTAGERNPIIASVMAQPDNLEFGHQVLGLPNLVIPQAAAKKKQLIEIGQLLKESPIPPDPQIVQQALMMNPALAQPLQQWQQAGQAAIQQGQEPPPFPLPDMMKPSIDVDPIFDFHEFEFETIKNWLSSEERRKQDMNGNKAGIENVRLHGAKHQALIPPPMPPPTGPGAGKPTLENAPAGHQPPPGPPPGAPGPPPGQNI